MTMVCAWTGEGNAGSATLSYGTCKMPFGGNIRHKGATTRALRPDKKAAELTYEWKTQNSNCMQKMLVSLGLQITYKEDSLDKKNLLKMDALT